MERIANLRVPLPYPHQNVAQYYGYVEKDGLMGGLCFRRYGQTLSDAVRTGLIRREDVEHSLDQIKKGTEHNHGLGLVHVSWSRECHDDRYISDLRARTTSIPGMSYSMRMVNWSSSTLIHAASKVNRCSMEKVVYFHSVMILKRQNFRMISMASKRYWNGWRKILHE